MVLLAMDWALTHENLSTFKSRDLFVKMILQAYNGLFDYF